MTDLTELDSYLSSDESPEGCMMLPELDGFLHGIACSPELVPVGEWIPVALGENPEDIPDWVLESVSVIYLNIIEGLTDDPPTVEPIFWETKEGQIIAMDWCEGFMAAVKLRSKEWLRLTESGIGGELITPVMVHLIDEDGNSAMGIPQEQLDETLAQAAEKIPQSVVTIHGFWGKYT